MAKKVKPTLLIVVGIIATLTIYFTISPPSQERALSEHTSSSNKLQLQLEIEKVGNIRQYGLNFQPNVKARLPEESTLRQQLAFQFPYEPKRPFPKNIWQTWKVPVGDEKFPKDYQRYQETWNEKNPGYKHHVLPDAACHELINQSYKTVPDVVEAYNSMPKSILKADFFRYLILFARGGVYSDIDTIGIKPVDTWASTNETLYDKPNTAGIVVGIEADPDRPDWNDWYARRIQFCQWTIQSKKGHPLLRDLIANITDITLTRKKNGKLQSILGKDAGGDIMDWTGPGIWTDSVFRYMNNIMQPEYNFKTGKFDDIVNWKMFTGMQVPILVEDVLVLPITSFSPDVGQMGSKSTSDPMAYAKHMFSGSWKPEDERMG